MEPKLFTELEKSLGITFLDSKILLEALTHRSYINEHPEVGRPHNERMEFLGDAVMELAITHYLFERYPDTPEGQLTAFRSALVRTESISESSRALGVNDFLFLSRGEARDQGKARDYILANAFEAIIGAIFLDQGFLAAEGFIARTLHPKIDLIVKKSLWRDAKSFVQERAQDVYSVTPTYVVLDQVGPDHDKVFTVGIYFGKDKIAEGVGHSKQDAEQKAARSALDVKGW